jgi:transposase InsO family protein
MSAAISPSTGQRYGLRRVCRIWEAPRSTVFYRRQERPAPKRRGPKPIIPDDTLLVMIREDLANSPFREEGYRKPYYRMKHERKIRVSAKRVLRIMGENNLLSPNRAPKGEPKAHDGRICVDRPLEMWGTDATMAQTVKEGTVWIFGGVDHWNAECIGIHASKSGDRFEAMEPIRQGIKKFYGSLTAQIAAGLALRSDHGCQYTSDHFQAELRYFGIRQSLAYVAEPQTNGVAERFWKTLKKQMIEGKIYQTLDDLRKALRAFVDTYNRHWRLEKLGGRTPEEARQAWLNQQAA